MKDPVESGELYEPKKLPRDSNGRLLPGHGSLNPGGKPKDQRNAQLKLHKALRKIEKIKSVSGGYTFLEHYIKEAFKDRTMAIALLKKIVPDLKAVEMSSEDTKVWQIILQDFAKPQNKEKENKE